MRSRALTLLLLLLLPACKRTPATTVLIAFGSEKKAWLEEQIARFNDGAPKLKDGTRYQVVGKAMGSGEASADILDGRLQPSVFSPASGAYVSLLNQAWLGRAGHTRAVAPAGDSVVLSPIVIAMWKPLAEALGWPRQALGWSDIIAIGRDPRGWGGRGHPSWGRFKLGHTHPEFSTSGLLAVVAESYAGAGKTRGLSAADLDAKHTQDFVASVEQAIVHYGKSTGFFSEKMRSRGAGYLSAAVLYENLVIESYANPTEMPMVAIYPREGTFWSDHPYSILDAPWVTPALHEGAEAFLAFLKARPAQERALALGFRPADPGLAIGAPIDAAHGVDPKQPQTLLEVPDAPMLEQVLATWRSVKKGSDVTLVFDKSGSMGGNPLTQAKAGATAFLTELQSADRVSLMFFDSQVYPVLGPKAGAGRASLATEISGVSAGGGTALYDAVISAYDTVNARAADDPGRIHALVVMTDGNDENSRSSLAAVRQKLQNEGDSPVKVFTIAYGDGASADALKSIAEAGGGSFQSGGVDNIVQVYRDIASFF